MGPRAMGLCQETGDHLWWCQEDLVKTGWREIMKSVSFNWKTAKRHLGRAKEMNKEIE